MTIVVCQDGAYSLKHKYFSRREDPYLKVVVSHQINHVSNIAGIDCVDEGFDRLVFDIGKVGRGHSFVEYQFTAAERATGHENVELVGAVVLLRESQ